MYYLFLDDIRDPKDGYLHGQRQKLVEYSGIPAGCWDVVRNHEQFIFKIKKHGMPRAISFDNDLCNRHFQLYCEAAVTGVFEWENAAPRMGLHCLQFILNECKEKNLQIPIIYIHTANIWARKIMEKMLDRDVPERKSEGGIILG